ncbi:MAG: macro domain-containing protein [Alphaproteobacteria bacterium]|nr:macro domain-containing protein [Alphaproteobacteria bacterium]
MHSKQYAAENGAIINIIHGRARDYLSAQNTDVFMTFIAQKYAFDSPINLLIGEILGAESMEHVFSAVKNAKSGDVVLQKSLSPDMPDIIFAVMPIWDTSLSNEEKFLSRCYRNGMKLAKQNGYQRMIIPALGKGKTNFPHQRIVRLSLSVILAELSAPLSDLSILCAEEVMYNAYNARLASV